MKDKGYGSAIKKIREDATNNLEKRASKAAKTLFTNKVMNKELRRNWYKQFKDVYLLEGDKFDPKKYSENYVSSMVRRLGRIEGILKVFLDGLEEAGYLTVINIGGDAGWVVVRDTIGNERYKLEVDAISTEESDRLRIVVECYIRLLLKQIKDEVSKDEAGLNLERYSVIIEGTEHKVDRQTLIAVNQLLGV